MRVILCLSLCLKDVILVASKTDGGREFHRGMTLDTKECRCKVDLQVGAFSASESLPD